MSVITIRGQMGSGAEEVGRLVAGQLKYDYVDREIIDRVARRLKLSRPEVSQKEMPPSTLFGRIAEVMTSSYAVNPAIPDVTLPTWRIPVDDTTFKTALERIIKGIAKKDNVVIRGRGSQFILRDNPGILHVLTVAPLEVRLGRVMQELKIIESEARKEIDEYDGSRRAFTKRYFKADLEDPANYGLVVNTGTFSFEAAASLVIRALEHCHSSD
jgi:cytidylate kinase